MVVRSGDSWEEQVAYVGAGLVVVVLASLAASVLFPCVQCKKHMKVS